MKLIVGLGNPGEAYGKTRHNVGFFMLDELAKNSGLKWQEKTKFKTLLAEHNTQDEKVVLMKPQTFYNNSGEAVRAVKKFYKIENKDVLVIHDELALPFGTVRTRQSGSNAGNNGVKSISAHNGADYWRIRIGIWNELQEKMDDADFVLSRFSSEEVSIIEKNINREVLKLINNFLNNDLETTNFKV